MLDQFKGYVRDRLDVDELVALSAYGKAFKAEFAAQGVEIPEYVEQNIKSIGREIQARVADHREALRKKLKIQLDGLKTTAERREELAAQLKQLDDLVGVGQ